MILAAILLTGTLTVEWIQTGEDAFSNKWAYDVSAVAQKGGFAYTRKPTKNWLDGESIDLPPDLSVWKWSATLKDGSWFDHGSQFRDSADIRLQRLIDFAPPKTKLRSGETWTVELPEVGVDLAPAATITYKVHDDAGDQSHSFSFEYAEKRLSNKMTATGSVVFSYEANHAIRIYGVALNAPMPGGDNSGWTYKFSLKLAPSKPK